MSEHTKEPWVCNENEYDEYIWGPNREMIAESRGTGGCIPQFENRRRIVACVNACAGISTEKLERGVIKEAMDMVDRLSREITALPTDCAGQNCHACANPCEKYIESLR